MAAARRIPEAGTLLAGKYLIERVLGQGGMGVVLAAHHEMLDQRVAIKLLLSPEIAGVAADRLLNEARAAARIDSEHIARPLDFGLLADGRPFIVMEYLDGHDLAAELDARGPLQVIDAVDCMIEALEGLDRAHMEGVIHRDLKPSNIFLARKRDGTIVTKLVDFGISKVQKLGSEASLTSTQTVMGSPVYMSPEQARSSKNVDHRTDIWSVGTILYELLSGRCAFESETMGELFAKIFAAEFTPIAAVRADVPPALAAVIDRCLQRDPAARYGHASEVALALAPFGSGAKAGVVERMRKRLSKPEMGSVPSLAAHARSEPALTAASAGAFPASKPFDGSARSPALAHPQGAWATSDAVAYADNQPRRKPPSTLVAAVAVVAFVAAALLAAGLVIVVKYGHPVARAQATGAPAVPSTGATPSAGPSTALPSLAVGEPATSSAAALAASAPEVSSKPINPRPSSSVPARVRPPGSAPSTGPAPVPPSPRRVADFEGQK